MIKTTLLPLSLMHSMNASETRPFSPSRNEMPPANSNRMTDNQINSIEQGTAEAASPSILKQSSHPVALIFHFLFRTAAVFVYLFGALFSSNHILISVITIVLLAFDFWTVKNVTGRLLVGLRWWNEIKEDGSNQWLFESRNNRNIKSNPVDSRLFWISLYCYPIFWVLLAVIAFLKFHFLWLLIVICAITLNMANLIGYTKCDKDAKKKMVSNLGTGLVGNFISSRLTNMFS